MVGFFFFFCRNIWDFSPEFLSCCQNLLNSERVLFFSPFGDFFPLFNLSAVLRIQVNYIVWIYYSPLTEWMFGLFFQAYMQLSLLIFVGDHNWPNSSLFIFYSKIASKQMIFSY